MIRFTHVLSRFVSPNAVRRAFFLFVSCLLLAQVAVAAVRLPRLFSDGMVLQRGKAVPVWGWVGAGQSVQVSLTPDGKKKAKYAAEAVADASGYFRVALPSMNASGPFVLTIRCGEEEVWLSDVWVGDVWLCSGQSNIDTNGERVYPQYPDEIDRDSTSCVRLFRVQNEAALDGACEDVRTDGWQYLCRRSAWKFSALGYFLGKRMAQETGVVQGIVQSSWGGTPIEAWLPRDSVRRLVPRMAAEADFYSDPALRRTAQEANAQVSKRWNQQLAQRDPGVAGRWQDADTDESEWKLAEQYKLPVAPGYFCGTYWLRQHIQIDAAHAGQPVLLWVGTLIDADETYLNGKLVGQTGYQYPPRRYQVPAGVLREGDNVLTVRFINHGQAPQFVREKPYELRWADGSVQPLSSQWLCREGALMPSQPSLPTGFQNMAGTTFDGMIHPLAPFALAGAVWYQGESNTDRAALYEQELTTLMQCWRRHFEQPELPFVIVQLANYMAPSQTPQESSWARLRESQRRAALADDKAELAVAIDLGEANDIHPLRKKELAERVAWAFDKLVFGKPGVLSPQPVRAEARPDGTVVVTFDQAVTGSQGFELFDATGHFRQVQASANGNQVVLQGSGTRVRYAWKHNPVEADCRAVDAPSLPATPFECEVK